MAKRHDQQAASRYDPPETRHGDLSRLAVDVLPDAAQGHQVERAEDLRLCQVRKPIVQPLDSVARMQRHSRLAKLFDGLDGEHAMSLPSEPGSIAASPRSYVGDTNRRCRKEIKNRRIELPGVKPVIPRDQGRRRCGRVPFKYVIHPGHPIYRNPVILPCRRSAMPIDRKSVFPAGSSTSV